MQTYKVILNLVLPSVQYNKRRFFKNKALFLEATSSDKEVEHLKQRLLFNTTLSRPSQACFNR